MGPRGPGVDQSAELKIHREYGGHPGQGTGQRVSLDSRQTLEDGGVPRQQRVVMDGQQEAELRVGLDRHRETRRSHTGQPGHVAGGQPGVLTNQRQNEACIDCG